MLIIKSSNCRPRHLEQKSDISSILSLFVIFLAVFFSSCSKTEFDVEFDLSPSADGTYRAVYYASDPQKGWIVENVVNIQQGKAHLTGIIYNPCIVYLCRTSNASQGLYLYVERGDDFTISGEGSDPAAWHVEGNKLTRQLDEWRTENRNVIVKARSGREADIAPLCRAVDSFVTSHPDDPAATIILMAYFDRRYDSERFAALMKSLRDDAADRKWIDLMARNDMPADEISTPVIPKSLIFATVATGCDTITPGRVPTLLYFGKASLQPYRDDITKLRQLSRSSGDSISRIIANVSFEPDSMTRWHGVNVDSLKWSVQAWAPLGLSDPQIKQLGVRRIPYIIVIDSKAKAVYSGTDTDRAIETFRSLLPKQ
ncbi:MAG: hypothetical protein ACI4AK_00360 [Lepagella sp.]